MRGRPTSLRNWIFIRTFLFVLAIIAPLFALVFVTTESCFRGYLYQSDMTKAMALAPKLQVQFEQWRRWDAVEVSGQDRVVILDADRQVVLDTAHRLMGTIHPQDHVEDAVPLFDQATTLGYLLVGTMIDPALTPDHATFLGSMLQSLAALFLFSLVFSIPLSWWLGTRLSLPLRSLVEDTQRAATGDWRQGDIPLTAPREVQELRESFFTLGAHLKSAEELKSQLLADVAHELRTPLTVVRGTVEAMIEGVFPISVDGLRVVYGETQRLEKIVESLRVLQEGEAPLTVVPFSWSTVVNHVAELFRPAAREKSQSIEVSGPDDLRGVGDPEAITQIMVNFVSNAVQYAPAGGWVRVEYGTNGTQTLVSVEDNGPGVPPSDRERIFERFVRLDPSRSSKTGGRGLGLAIVKKLSSRLRGTVTVVSGSAGGARFELTLPVR